MNCFFHRNISARPKEGFARLKGMESKMKDKICYIVGAGVNYNLDFVVTDMDIVIAADGGLDHLQKAGIAANLSIGDFDSVKQRPTHGIVLDSEKDFTDMFAAMQEGLTRGYKLFHIYCGTGGRFDHTFANIQMLGYLAAKNKRGYLIGRDYVITAIADGEGISFGSSCNGYISVFSFSDTSTGVCIKGLKYEVDDFTFENINPMGVSNEFVGVGSSISIEKGTLLVIFPRDSFISSLIE